MIDILLWFFLLECLSFAVFPLLAHALPWLPDYGWGLAKAGGLLFWGMTVWLFTSFGVASSSAGWSCAFLGLALTASSAHLKKNRFELLRRREVLGAELTFYAVAAVFLLIRCRIPEIQWGEKPMDFSFLNYFTRLQTLPPEDPWASGQGMHYYYLGYYIIGLLLKVTGISPAIGYNLAVATLPAILAASLFSVFLTCSGAVRCAIASAFAVVFFADAEVLRLVFFEAKAVDSHLFWASTRLFTSPSFFEYPLWSYLFADLHPHMMALPFTALLLGLGIRMLDAEIGTAPGLLLHRSLYAGTWASLVMLNAWDFITYGLLSGIVLVFRPWPAAAPERLFFVELLKRAGELLSLSAVAMLLVSPFLMGGTGGEGFPGLIWAEGGEFNTLYQVLWAHGVWLLPLFSIWTMQFSIGLISGPHRTQGIPLACICGCFPLVLGMLSRNSNAAAFPWGILAAMALLMFLAAASGSRKEQPICLRYAAVCTICAAGLVSGAELLSLIDRMNTIFKFHTAASMLFIIAAVLAAGALFQTYKGYSRFVERGALAIGGAAGLLASAFVFYIFCGTELHWSERGPRLTLDGTMYLDWSRPGEAAVIRWLQANVPGTPTLLEAFGPSYQRYTRIAANTGLKAVLGWEYHVRQRGTSETVTQQRIKDIESIYNTTDEALARSLLGKYGVSYIVVGELERARYAAEGLTKFAKDPRRYPLFYRAFDTSVYGIVANDVSASAGTQPLASESK